MFRLDDPRLATLASIALVGGLLWWMLAASMGGGSMEMATDLTPGAFAGASVMWIVMMLAMMLPAMAPVMMQYATLAAKETRGAALAGRVTLLGAGYFSAWGIVSVALAGMQLLAAQTALFTMGGTLATPAVSGVLLIAAGAWQFTAIKDVCLVHCRRPLAWLIAHWRPGAGGALRMGAHHGAYCVGCCVALMGTMFVFGAMNVVWMAIIAAYFVAEKLAPAAERWSRVAGAAMILAGGATLARSLF